MLGGIPEKGVSLWEPKTRTVRKNLDLCFLVMTRLSQFNRRIQITMCRFHSFSAKHLIASWYNQGLGLWARFFLFTRTQLGIATASCEIWNVFEGQTSSWHYHCGRQRKCIRFFSLRVDVVDNGFRAICYILFLDLANLKDCLWIGLLHVVTC